VQKFDTLFELKVTFLTLYAIVVGLLFWLVGLTMSVICILILAHVIYSYSNKKTSLKGNNQEVRSKQKKQKRQNPFDHSVNDPQDLEATGESDVEEDLGLLEEEDTGW
jgi:predicted membrane protein